MKPRVLINAGSNLACYYHEAARSDKQLGGMLDDVFSAYTYTECKTLLHTIRPRLIVIEVEMYLGGDAMSLDEIISVFRDTVSNPRPSIILIANGNKAKQAVRKMQREWPTIAQSPELPRAIYDELVTAGAIPDLRVLS